MTFVSSNSARSAYREWTDKLLALLADADAHNGMPRVKARAAALDMMRVRAVATKAAAKDNFGWDRIMATAVLDAGRVRSVAPDERP